MSEEQTFAYFTERS